MFSFTSCVAPFPAVSTCLVTLVCIYCLRFPLSFVPLLPSALLAVCSLIFFLLVWVPSLFSSWPALYLGIQCVSSKKNVWSLSSVSALGPCSHWSHSITSQSAHEKCLKWKRADKDPQLLFTWVSAMCINIEGFDQLFKNIYLCIKERPNTQMKWVHKFSFRSKNQSPKNKVEITLKA